MPAEVPCRFGNNKKLTMDVPDVTAAKNAFHNIFHLSTLDYHTGHVDVARVFVEVDAPRSWHSD
jgi:hypothetical protein